MKKAFIFDLDGVIINSEPVWERVEQKFLTQLFGAEIYNKIQKEILGSNLNSIYDSAKKIGFAGSKTDFLNAYDGQAEKVYESSNLTNHIDDFIEYLTKKNFILGIVTASPLLWVEQALKKLKNKNAFLSILSIYQRDDLLPKPSPDGFIEMIKILKSTPENTIILEDSNKGVTAAKKSGAFTICLKENLPTEYKYNNLANIYVKNIPELIGLFKSKKI
jgi:beta-phosphoglucomutase-like phosphatase (HAD superfamily)